MVDINNFTRQTKFIRSNLSWRNIRKRNIGIIIVEIANNLLTWVELRRRLAYTCWSALCSNIWVLLDSRLSSISAIVVFNIRYTQRNVTLDLYLRAIINLFDALNYVLLLKYINLLNHFDYSAPPYRHSTIDILLFDSVFQITNLRNAWHHIFRLIASEIGFNHCLSDTLSVFDVSEHLLKDQVALHIRHL